METILSSSRCPATPDAIPPWVGTKSKGIRRGAETSRGGESQASGFKADRPEYRARLAKKLESVRDEETGLWNDRVFKRSAAYGTAAAVLALSAPLLPPPAGWSAPERPAGDE